MKRKLGLERGWTHNHYLSIAGRYSHLENERTESYTAFTKTVIDKGLDSIEFFDPTNTNLVSSRNVGTDKATIVSGGMNIVIKMKNLVNRTHFRNNGAIPVKLMTIPYYYRAGTRGTASPATHYATALHNCQTDVGHENFPWIPLDSPLKYLGKDLRLGPILHHHLEPGQEVVRDVYRSRYHISMKQYYDSTVTDGESYGGWTFGLYFFQWGPIAQITLDDTDSAAGKSGYAKGYLNVVSSFHYDLQLDVKKSNKDDNDFFASVSLGSTLESRNVKEPNRLVLDPATEDQA